MRYENKRESRVSAKPEPDLTVPVKAGFYWAKWKICDEGTADEAVFEPSTSWEVVEVLDDFDGTPNGVFVPGVEKSQSLENFAWAKPIAPLPAPQVQK